MKMWSKPMFNNAVIVIVVIVTLVVAISMYERKDIVIEKVVLIALLSALAAVGRVLFFFIPSVQPSSFIIIVTGMVFGREMGMMTGLITAFASNLVLGQGPWTPWQMMLWGTMGWIAGILSKALLSNKFSRVVYGLIWGFVFGWIMNMWFVVGYEPDVTGKAIIIAAITSFPMDLAHALSNALLMTVAGDRLIRTFRRIALKYGIQK